MQVIKMITDLKKVTQNQIVSKSDVYGVYLGTFFDNAFTWYLVKEFKDLKAAYKEFKNYVNTQLKYTDEELVKVWDTGRLDIELRQGSKLLNWVGIYCREAQPLTEKEEKKVEEGKVEKPKAKDSMPDEIPAAIADQYKEIESVAQAVCGHKTKTDLEEGYGIRWVHTPHSGEQAHAIPFDYLVIVDVRTNNLNRMQDKNKIYNELLSRGYRLNEQKNGYRVTAYI